MDSNNFDLDYRSQKAKDYGAELQQQIADKKAAQDRENAQRRGIVRGRLYFLIRQRLTLISLTHPDKTIHMAKIKYILEEGGTFSAFTIRNMESNVGQQGAPSCATKLSRTNEHGSRSKCSQAEQE